MSLCLISLAKAGISRIPLCLAFIFRLLLVFCTFNFGSALAVALAVGSTSRADDVRRLNRAK